MDFLNKDSYYYFNHNDDIDIIKENIIKSKSCIGCDFVHNDKLQIIVNQIDNNKNEINNYHFENCTFDEKLYNFNSCEIINSEFLSNGIYKNLDLVFNNCNLRKVWIQNFNLNVLLIQNSNCWDIVIDKLYVKDARLINNIFNIFTLINSKAEFATFENNKIKSYGMLLYQNYFKKLTLSHNDLNYLRMLRCRGNKLTMKNNKLSISNSNFTNTIFQKFDGNYINGIKYCINNGLIGNKLKFDTDNNFKKTLISIKNILLN